MTSLLLALPLIAGAQTQAPDTAYFKQGVEYRIEASLDEATSVLSARARLHYTNRSSRRIDTLYFHLHLNAFRPTSAWAGRELESDNRRFQDLGPLDHAYERLKSVTVAGQPVTPLFPGAPDSTVAAVPLPAPLGPGDVVSVRIDWDARLSTLPRRQGRRGRHYDFAQWYPKIAVFDRGGWQVQPLMPQGEFYGEFASFDVTLEVGTDQVIGATGVPVDGDPGWLAKRAPGSAEPVLDRDAYPAKSAEPLGLLGTPPATGRKRVRWRAEQVHHFAWSMDPAYIHEGGAYDNVTIHVLYLPPDTAWRDVAVERTRAALAFMDTIFGPFPWPQLTNVHRIEDGGTEFPMLIMDGSAAERLIVHEVAHNYVMGVLANNEWRQGWLDEGFAQFLTNWYSERRGLDEKTVWADAMESIRSMERAGRTQPIALPSAAFRDFGTYTAMTYTKPSLIYRMLRHMLGEETFRRGLRLYYERSGLRHVREEDLRAALEEAAGRDLRWFFLQWIHTTATLDYSVTAARTRELADGMWETTVDVTREGEAFMPVTLKVGEEIRRLESRAPTQTVTVRTATRPAQVVLDPDNVLIDIQPQNNRMDVR